MKRDLLLNIAVLSFCLLLPVVGHSEQVQTSSMASPVVNLSTQITVQASSPVLQTNFSGTGEIEVRAEFNVAASIPKVRMHASATDLHFKANPGSVAPIPLVVSSGVQIEAQGAQAIDPRSTIAQFNGETEQIDGFTARKTAGILFQSTDTFTFNHPVFVTVKWNQEEANKPSGIYEGRIKLTCMVEPQI